MLDLARLRGIRLAPKPHFQRAVGGTLLHPMYQLFPGVPIHFEGFNPEDLKGRSVIFAMNHTDRYNYFPFQMKLWKGYDRYTATWVKGKYFENPVLAAFFEAAAQIPVPSRGYLISRDFKNVVGREPSQDEYAALRSHFEAQMLGRIPAGAKMPDGIPPALQSQARSMLGRPFDGKEDYFDAIRNTFDEMMDEFVALNQQATEVGLNIIVFPQGTRSKRLSKGHIGLAQMALHLDLPIIPVGCNGCDHVYPGNSPIPRAGKITYRFGKPIEPKDMEAWRPKEPFRPFIPEDEHKHRANFQALVDHVMDQINELLDPEYQYAEDKSSDGVKGTDRFL